ncbi:MAG: AAA family ATPase [Gemmataceae bacterium]
MSSLVASEGSSLLSPPLHVALPTPDFFTGPPRWLDFPAVAPATPITWLWQGYLATGNVTLLTSQWKTGKTTLLSLLLDRMRTGGALAGFPVAAGNVLVLSEEGAAFWDERDGRLRLRGHVGLLSQPFAEALSPERWLVLLDWILALHATRRLSLVAIDSIASFLPVGVENNAGRALQCLGALRRLTQSGLAVLLNHHPRKGLTVPGQASRGSGALPAYVDILVEMQGLPAAAPDDRRRRLRAFSRHTLTPRDLVLEWTADGLDYDVRIPQEDGFDQTWDVLRLVFEDAQTKLTRQQALDDWPPDFLKPTAQTLWRWLDAASERGLLHRDGLGRRTSPFRYWLPGKLDQWLADPWLFVHNPELYEEMLAAERASKRELQQQQSEKQAEEDAARKAQILHEPLLGLAPMEGSRATGEP